MSEKITEDWLREVGFKWHQFDRQPDKHWLLWLGSALARRHGGTDTEDLGIDLAPGMRADNPDWFCWLRCDMAGRYHRFIHVRHLLDQIELIRLVEALTNLPWNPANHLFGCVFDDEGAARRRDKLQRLDVELIRDRAPWHDMERDPTAGRPLPEHQRGYMDDRKVKTE